MLTSRASGFGDRGSVVLAQPRRFRTAFTNRVFGSPENPGRRVKATGKGRWARSLFLALGLFLAAACSGKSAEERAHEAAEQIRQAAPDFEAIALEQQVEEATVKEVQSHLATLHEYQGEINGKLDSVTVNAIQAFQRSARLKDDGIIDTRTRERLAAAAAKAKK